MLVKRVALSDKRSRRDTRKKVLKTIGLKEIGHQEILGSICGNLLAVARQNDLFKILSNQETKERPRQTTTHFV